MAAYRRLLEEALLAMGFRVRCLTAAVRMGKLAPKGSRAAKWLGYLDQFVLFPVALLREQRRWTPGTQVVVSDQALGPWVPLIRRFPHLVICHDLLALRASRGEFRGQSVGWTGRIYQAWIRHGFRQAQRFAAVSDASRRDLARELPAGHEPIEVLYNPLQPGFTPMATERAMAHVERVASGLAGAPYLLHVGSNWYKNREGVVAVFQELRRSHSGLQLVLVGAPEQGLSSWLARHAELAPAVRMLHSVDHAALQALYSLARVLFFPSILEGFGWPVLEALACGCAVVTTAQPPLTEVAGDAAVYLPLLPAEASARQRWVGNAAARLREVLDRSAEEQQCWRDRGLRQAARFSLQAWQDGLAEILSAAGCRG